MQQEMHLEKRPLASHNRINPTKRAISGDPIVFPVIKDALPSFLSTSSGNSPRGKSPQLAVLLTLGVRGCGSFGGFSLLAFGGLELTGRLKVMSFMHSPDFSGSSQSHFMSISYFFRGLDRDNRSIM